jgi:hypothetical protein
MDEFKKIDIFNESVIKKILKDKISKKNIFLLLN